MQVLIILLSWPLVLSQGLVPSAPSCPDTLPPSISHLPNGLQQQLQGITVTPTNLTDSKACAVACCAEVSCNAALTINKDNTDQCLLVSCESDHLCIPAPEPSEYTATLVLVRPRSPPWPSLPPGLAGEGEEGGDRGGGGVGEGGTVCEVGLDQEACKAGEYCKPLNAKSRNGVCICQDGFVASDQGCVRLETTPVAVTTAPPVSTIAVSVGNKTITLPESSATLTAFTVPSPSPTNTFKYQWQAQTANLPGTESDATKEVLKLSGLAEGVYIFKVTVTSSNPPGFGETTANVTVLPEPRINTPPHAVVAPLHQNVTLPTHKAIIDGGQSSDDSNTLTYSWSISSGPMGYQPQLPSVPTLTLDNLIAGNYTVKLTVKDKEGQTDSAVATLTVLKETDYRPTASAGEDKIVFLPQNSVVLNGNQSTDDHEITSWEWTKKKPEDGIELPADIEGARTPYLKVSSLELGIYNFVLKVTDSANQTSKDEVSVYVKPPSNLPPTANAGPDQDLSLPLPYITLDGSGSKDDINITQYSWVQIEGPKAANISKADQPITNVTNLGVGKYKFQLTVRDGNQNNASDEVVVTIRQDSNQAPVARIVQPDKLEMPVRSLLLDGSRSTDDLAVESWQWTRDPDSSSAGTVVGSMNGPRLLLVDLLQGTYVFMLTVRDAQGKSDSAKVRFTVEEDKESLAAVEMVLDKQLAVLSQADLGNVLSAVKIFVKARSDVVLETLTPARRTGFATIVFKVKSADEKFMKGLDVVEQLESTLVSNPDLLGIPVLSLETVVCQNTCGGHGTCDQATRECSCQPFWMENSFSRYLLHGKPNCDWSVIYVSVVVVGLLLTVLLLYCLYCGCRKGSRVYSGLETGDIELKGSRFPGSETDSEDEEVLFETSAKKGRRLNGSVPGLRESSNGLLAKSVA